MVKIRIWLNAWLRVEDRERAMVSVNTIKIVIITNKPPNYILTNSAI